MYGFTQNRTTLASQPGARPTRHPVARRLVNSSPLFAGTSATVRLVDPDALEYAARTLAPVRETLAAYGLEDLDSFTTRARR